MHTLHSLTLGLVLLYSVALIVECGCVRLPGQTAAAAPAAVKPSPVTWPPDVPLASVPDPDRIVILPGPSGHGEGFTLAPASSGYQAILAYARRLARDACAVTLDAGVEVSVDAGSDEIHTDLGGALLVFGQPVVVSVTNTPDRRLLEFRSDHRLRFDAIGTTHLFIPCPAWSGRTLAGDFYVLHGGGWLAPQGRQPHDRPPDTCWATLWSPLAETVGPTWLESLLARYLRPQDLRPGWPLPPRGIPEPGASRQRPGVDPVWHKPPLDPLPTPSRVIAYLPGRTRVELPPGDPWCRRLYRVLEGTLDLAATAVYESNDFPLGLCGQDGPEPDWPGVLVTFDQPMNLVVRTPVMPDMARYFVVAWWQYQVPQVSRAYFPAIMPQANHPELSDAVYIHDHPNPIVWGIYNSGRADRQRQRALGSVLEELRRELGEG